MDTSSKDLGIPMTPAQYAQQWADTAEQLAAANNYRWMAEQLGTAQHVVEIGCGSGHSSLELLQAARHLAVVEVNPELLDIAKERLNAHGFAHQTVLAPGKGHAVADTAVNLLLASVFDQAVAQLCAPQSLDAIVCWLAGSSPGYIAKQQGVHVSALTGESVPAYRTEIHRRCYALGRQWLRPGGVVHIVDRIGLRSWSDKDDVRDQLVEMHADLSGTAYGIERRDVILRRIDSIGKSKIQYLTAPDANIQQLTLASIKLTLR